MPLASWFALHWYGPACGAMVEDTAGGVVVQAGGSGIGRVESTTTAGVGAVVEAKATRLRSGNAVIAASGAITQALPKANGRVGAVISVNELTQSDVGSAVIDAPIEGTLTLRDILRTLLAVNAGQSEIDTAGPSPVVRFRSRAGTTVRVEATMDGSERTAVTLNPTGT